MEIHITKTAGAAVVAIRGKLDAQTVPELQKSIATWPVMPTVLDLSGLEYLSSTALRVLLQLERDFDRQEKRVVISGTSGLVDKVMRVSGFEQIFMLYPTVEDALKGIAGESG